MVKRALTLITSIIIALHLLMPFNIYADTLPQSEIVGVTYNKIDQDITYLNGTGTYTYVYEIEVLLKNKYVGVVDGTLSYSYSEVPNSQTVTTSKKTYVNGDSFKLNVSIIQMGSSFTGTSPMYSASFLVNAQNTNVTKYEDLTSIDSIISLLQDIYTNSNDIENLSTNQLSELVKIVQNTSISNQYLESLNKLRQWNIPIESYSVVLGLLQRGNEPENINNINYFNYPVFNFGGNKIGSSLLYFAKSQASNFAFIFHTNIPYSSSALNEVFGVFDQNDTEYNNVLIFDNTVVLGSYSLIKFHLDYDNAPTIINLKTKKNIGHFIPIYYGNLTGYMSTDFALQFGYSNKLLDDIHIIANGTTVSQSAAQSTDSANSQLQNESNTLFQQENAFKSDMQNAMQNVNNTFRLQDMGTKFVSSAQWVRTQYENLTNNTPFASLITFSLITGLALILLGKVYK